MIVTGTSERGVFETIAIGRIKPSARNPRVVTSDSIGELVSSIREIGLMEPLVVRPVHDWFEVVAGHRRLEACKRLNLRQVPCHVVVMDERQAFETSLVENVQRQNLNALEEAIAFRRYVTEYGYGGITDLARRIGKSQSYVSRRISLLGLPEQVRDGILRRRITPAVAQELVSLEQSEAEMLAEVASTKGLSRSEVRALAKSKGGSRVPPMRVDLGGSADRSLSKALASLRVCLMRLDDAIRSVGDEDWIVREALANDRSTIHQVLDGEIRLKIRVKRQSAQRSF
jgi:ParB family chromosome partitioning protein